MTTNGMGGTDGMTGQILTSTGRNTEETPTEHLRFVERHIDFAGTIKPVRILQQLWQITKEGDNITVRTTEWRDVPLEREE